MKGWLLQLFVSLFLWTGALCNSNYQTNVLYIMYDDLRPLFHAYGEKYMITPNFDRLAARSVLFQNAYCQVAVCSPSRTSLMSGLRPDTLKGYSFDRNHHPNVGFPDHFKALNYNIAGYGKIYHNDEFPDSEKVGYGIGKSGWYEYQNLEESFLNSTVVPDKSKAEELFRDYVFASKTIEGLTQFSTDKSKFFFVGVGFKLPHTRLHYPHKYYDLYRSRSKLWMNVDPRYLRFPPTAPSPSYRCCTYIEYQYMSTPDEGQSKFTENYGTHPNLNTSLPSRMFGEQMWSYCASISYLDVQLGRLMDTLDALNLWNNITIILTADHGMHNGEKGIWEKWTLFDEATRIPLLIYHPLSPFKGQQYTQPVELVDIYPTLLDFAGVSYPSVATGGDASYNPESSPCFLSGRKCPPLDGLSLAPIVLGSQWQSAQPAILNSRQDSNVEVIQLQASEMPTLPKHFAVSQVTRCAKISALKQSQDPSRSDQDRLHTASHMWETCNRGVRNDEKAYIAYSLRTKSFRYTAYLALDKKSFQAILPPLDSVKNISLLPRPDYEELYDHRRDSKMPIYAREMHNVASHPKFQSKAIELYGEVLNFIKTTRRAYAGR